MNRKAVLIDLGLSSREYELEGFGIDLHVLHEILRASHPDVKEQWIWFSKDIKLR